jgi:hypothetical protein
MLWWKGIESLIKKRRVYWDSIDMAADEAMIKTLIRATAALYVVYSDLSEVPAAAKCQGCMATDDISKALLAPNFEGPCDPFRNNFSPPYSPANAHFVHLPILTINCIISTRSANSQLQMANLQIVADFH